MVADADDRRAVARGLLGLLRTIDRDAHKAMRAAYEDVKGRWADIGEIDGFLEGLETEVLRLLPGTFDLSYERQPATGAARYVLRRTGHEHLDEPADLYDAYDRLSGLAPEEPEPRFSGYVPLERDARQAGGRPACDENSGELTARAAGTTEHLIANARCQRCGCSETAITGLGLACRPSTRPEPESASQLNPKATDLPQAAGESRTENAAGPDAASQARQVASLRAEVERLRSICARIVARYDRETRGTLKGEDALMLAWAMRSDASEGVAEQ